MIHFIPVPVSLYEVSFLSAKPFAKGAWLFTPFLIHRTLARRHWVYVCRIIWAYPPDLFFIAITDCIWITNSVVVYEIPFKHQIRMHCPKRIESRNNLKIITTGTAAETEQCISYSCWPNTSTYETFPHKLGIGCRSNSRETINRIQARIIYFCQFRMDCKSVIIARNYCFTATAARAFTTGSQPGMGRSLPFVTTVFTAPVDTIRRIRSC